MYLMALNVMAVIAVFHAFSSMFVPPATGEERAAYMRSTPPYALLLLGTMLSCTPLMVTLLMSSEDSVDRTGGLGFVWISMAGGILWLLALALIIRKEMREGLQQSFMRMGRNVIGVLACLLVIAAAVQQIRFVEKNTGILNLSLVKVVAKSEGVRLDVECQAGVVLATFTEGRPVTLRCPKLITLTPFTQYPFAPWPEYEDMESQSLADLVVQISKEAKAL